MYCCHVNVWLLCMQIQPMTNLATKQPSLPHAGMRFSQTLCLAEDAMVDAACWLYPCRFSRVDGAELTGYVLVSMASLVLIRFPCSRSLLHSRPLQHLPRRGCCHLHVGCRRRLLVPQTPGTWDLLLLYSWPLPRRFIIFIFCTWPIGIVLFFIAAFPLRTRHPKNFFQIAC